jgi:hypothetical protein
MNSCRYPEVAKNSALFQKLVAGEWINRHQNLLILGPTESDSCPHPAILLECHLILTRLRDAGRRVRRASAPDIGTCEIIGPSVILSASPRGHRIRLPKHAPAGRGGASRLQACTASRHDRDKAIPTKRLVCRKITWFAIGQARASTRHKAASPSQ